MKYVITKVKPNYNDDNELITFNKNTKCVVFNKININIIHDLVKLFPETKYTVYKLEEYFL